MESLMERKDTVHVSFSIWDLSDSYNRYAGVALVSLLENTLNPVCIHLLYDENLHNELPSYSANRQAYKDIEEKYGCAIHFHHVDAPSWLHNLPSVRFFSFGSFLRLFLPNILRDINRVIYLDCDICVTADISELWYINLNGKAIGVDDMNLNSGVIVFDLSNIRQNYNLSKQALDFLSKHPRTDYPDQDALQYIFKDDCLYFDRKWNITSQYHPEYAGMKGIFHFTWIKPWKVWSGGTFAEYEFWRYFSKTPWGDDVVKLSSEFATCLNLSFGAAQDSANRLIYYPISYRLKYWLLFTKKLISLHWKELIVRIKDKILFWKR